MPLGYRVGLWPIAFLALSGCLRFGLEVPDSGAAGDADSDADVDVDSDADADGDAPVDAPSPVDADEDDGSSGGDADVDADVDAVPDADADAGCGPFTSIAILSTASSAETDWAPAVTADELLLFFESDRSDEFMLYVAERATTAEPFGTPVVVSVTTDVTTPSVSADGLELFFNQWSVGYRASRPTRTAAFSTPEPLVVTGTADAVHDAELLADGETLCLTLYSAVTRDIRLALAARASTGRFFALEPGLEELDEPGTSEGFCTMSSDGLEIIFESDRPGAFGVLTSRRTAASDPFPPGVPLVLPIESLALSDPELSADGRSLYIGAVLSEAGSWDLIRASRRCD